MKENEYLLRINNLFENLKIKAEVASCKIEPPFVICDIVLSPGGSFKKIEKHAMEIALSTKATSMPIIYPITANGVVKMEIMTNELPTVLFSELKTNDNLELPLFLGKKRNGECLIPDLTNMPHLLIGGATGSGKSVLLQSILNGMILNSDCRFVLIDPKRVEFSYYDNIENLFCPVARSVDEALYSLRQLIDEMERRFKVLENNECRNKSSYKGDMPYIVVVIDELADLMMVAKKEAHKLICRLAQKSRACGIHLIAATQRPSVDVVTGIIKANFPSRIACQVMSSIDSRTILGKGGAENLTGKGDGVIFSPGNKYVRFKGAYISENEIQSNVNKKIDIWESLWRF